MDEEKKMENKSKKDEIEENIMSEEGIQGEEMKQMENVLKEE